MHIFSINKALGGQSAFKIGIPLPKGEFSANANLSLFVEGKGVKGNGELIVRAHTKAINLWPDKSIRWLLVEGVLPNAMASGDKICIEELGYVEPQVKQKWVISKQNEVHIRLNNHNLIIPKRKFLEFKDEHCTKQVFADFIVNNGPLDIGQIELEYYSYYDQYNKPLLCEIKQTAKCKTIDGSSINLSAKVRIIHPLNQIDLQVKIHNPQPVVHHGGKWDLGNENSIYVNRFSIEHRFNTDVTMSANLAPSSNLIDLFNQGKDFEHLKLVQHSSGGALWNSPNHKTADNTVHLKHKGASCVLDNVQMDMLRPEPNVCVKDKGVVLAIFPHDFWQKFPHSITAQDKSLSLSFTDVDSVYPIELQPGETKSHDVSWLLLQTTDGQEQVLTSPELTISRELINNSGVLPWFNTSIKNDQLQGLISNGVDGQSDFFTKREALDEYGWRHFGDIYADHETQYHEGDDPFVSHYNNQYDPLYGFLKQWLVSGDSRWKRLADELFDHLVNIDIYKTTLDKPEYNHGLFWHTDHYVQAQTATHRTYSKYQQSDVYMDHAGGGGPGAHHCYASGLALYYWLSGDQDAYDSLLGMTDWMHSIYEGDDTFLGLVLRMKNANHLKVPLTNKLLFGCGTGVLRNVFTNQYPLDRGTGNYVNILLDTFELTQDLQYLNKAERVISNTISENDLIADRHFEDIENTWYYLVLLQAVAKYLFIISQMKEPRPHGASILSAFLFYADYIAEHESPYLTKKESLEYPNDTWTAQDLRKVNLLCSAAFFVKDAKKDAYIKKAQYLQNWIENKLSSSNENAYTRVLVLMMQNYGSLQLLKDSNIEPYELNTSEQSPKLLTPSYLARCIRFVRRYSIRKEKSQLVKRIPKLSKWLGEAK